MSGGVRNLRAMFENKDEAAISPPDRGRSPAGSIGGGSNGTSPRPLSKVRTSFVAVERSGQLGTQWGLRKEGSTDPSLAVRRTSFNIDEETDPKAMADRTESINSELALRRSNTAITETIPETAVETPPVESDKKLGYPNRQGKIFSSETKSSGNSEKKKSVEDRNTKFVPGDTISSAVVSGGTALKNDGGSGENLRGNTSEKLGPTSPNKVNAKTALAGRTAKPGPISTAPSSAAAKPAPKATKSPSNPKTPTTPANNPIAPGQSGKVTTSKPTNSSSSKAQNKPANMKVVKSTSSPATTSKPVAQPAVPSTAATIVEGNPVHVLPANGFHKPKPRSPTRPAKLPASMTAPTASSLSKVATNAPLSRQSHAAATKTVSRSRSYASLSQKQELQQKPSKLNNDRPALGRPSSSILKKQPSRQSLPKHTVQADETFLARMMRPTTSSASKTTEKIISPPRLKTSTRPTTRDGSGDHKLQQGLNGSPSAKKPLPAAKDLAKEDSSVFHMNEAQDTRIPIIGISRPNPSSAENIEATIPVSIEDRLVAASSNENEHVKELPTELSTKLAPVSITAAKDVVSAKQNVEEPINDEILNSQNEAPEFVKEQPSLERSTVPEESDNNASIFLKKNLQSEDLVENDEPTGIVQPVIEFGKMMDREAQDGIAQGVEDVAEA